MILLLGTLAWLVGATLFTLSTRQLVKANPEKRIPPFFGSPPNAPGRAYQLRAAGMVLLALSALIWAEVLGYWAIGLIFLGIIPTALLLARHNHLVVAH